MVTAGVVAIAGGSIAVGVMFVKDYERLAVPPGSSLPSGAECASTIDRSGWEPVPENDAANHHVPRGLEVGPRSDYTAEANERVLPRIDGEFTGTTDEIIAWGACKWGFDADLVRAQAFVESSWDQSTEGDPSNNPEACVPGEYPPCPTSFGLLQIKHVFHAGSYPASLESTAFNVDYALGMIRACYEGWIAYLPNDYGPGDLEGCLGHHYSGRWRDNAGMTYAADVLDIYRNEAWQSLRQKASGLMHGRPSRSTDRGADPRAR